jgi:hypothetical protein
MHRSINLCTDDARTILSNMDNTNINQLNNIVNFSVDTINCEILEYVISSHLSEVLSVIYNKIRKNGILVLRFKDFKEISHKYYQTKMSDEEYLQKISNTASIISIDRIISTIDNNLSVHNIEYNNDYITMIIKRLKN